MLGITNMKTTVFCVVALCVVWYKFTDVSEALVTSITALMMETASTSETLVNVCQSTLLNNPEDSNLHTRRRENLKSQLQIWQWYNR
jgi:hypothetical protein